MSSFVLRLFLPTLVRLFLPALGIILLSLHPAIAQEKDTATSEATWKLWNAVRDGDLEAAQLALDSGAVVNSRFGNGETPLMQAVRQNNMLMFELLIDHDADIHIRDTIGRTALWEAVWAKNELLFGQLVMLGASIDDTTYNGDHLISYAADLGRYSIMRMILNAEVNVDVPMKSPARTGYTPLMLAAQRKSLSCMQLLLERGASLEARTLTGQTPLSVAAQSSDTTIVRFLLDQGAEVNVQDNFGRTPLMYSVMPECRKDVFRMLLGAGANPMIKDNEGETVYTLAKRSNCTIE